MRADWRNLPRGILDRLRYQSHSGLLIRRHRALRRLDFKSASILHPLLLLGASYALLALLGQAIALFWLVTLRFWLSHLGLDAELDTRPTQLFGVLAFSVPQPRLAARLPDLPLLQAIALVAVIAMSAAFVGLRRDRLPLAYLVWAIALIQLIACAFFAVAPGAFPHRLGKHVADGFEAVGVLLLLAPLLLSFSFYAFDHGIAKKAAGTIVILLGLILVAPYQYLAHMVLVDHFSLALLPPLFALFGLLFDIAVFVSLYAWVVSWEP